MNPPNWENINPNQFDYSLPQQRIAQFPLKDRDDSKLLFYDRGEIKHQVFKELIDLIPSNSLLFFNNTKVIPARIFFEKPTGAQIEIFLLQPVSHSKVIEEVMKTNKKCTWFCIIGNLKKWRTDQPLTRNLNIGTKQETLYAKLLDKNKHLVEFTWDDPEIQFGAIVGAIGKIPLPPYIERETVSLDKERYQTVYARYEGAVAAPTAGLHFTQPQLEELVKKGIQIDYLTLHVSGATFQPIKTTNLKDHPMHAEHIIISKNILKHLMSLKTIIAVGTTSMRTLESIYWYGVQLLMGTNSEFKIDKLAPYDYDTNDLPGRDDALNEVLKFMNKNQTEKLAGETSIFIFPGYKFKICDGLITNFHLPKSTLLLLIAALVGEDWRTIYEEALTEDYRFLSYGDSSLLLPKGDS